MRQLEENLRDTAEKKEGIEEMAPEIVAPAVSGGGWKGGGVLYKSYFSETPGNQRLRSPHGL